MIIMTMMILVEYLLHVLVYIFQWEKNCEIKMLLMENVIKN